MTAKLYDLTQTFTGNMPVYPGDPPASLRRVASISEEGFTDHKIEAGLHVGTHIDAPLHMIEGGKTISEIPLHRFSGAGHLIDVRGLGLIESEVLDGMDIPAGDILLFMTGFDAHFGEPIYYESYPELSVSLARRIVEMGVSIVGLDSPSPDRAPFPVHKTLLGGGCLIIENLTGLEQLAEKQRFHVFAYPAKFQADAAPVRVVADVS